jgi:TolA-binding protein
MIEKYPSSIWIPEAHYHIGISLMRQGQAAQAKAEFEWVIKNAPGSRWSAFSKERLGEIK